MILKSPFRGLLAPNLKNAQSIFCDQNNKKLSKNKR
ncbi:hypothetical protein HPLT_07260 [Helicobacter pylori Lithuania75]|nr:hypothetical protein HPLT_07260 [Helicobacter pylori Lithuania75]EIE28517.1 Hypothetical protein HP17_03749 [Helicobacter pylori NCTC 11637 = CCUG 17874 = ATCC 43504 = JCM 12093]